MLLQVKESKRALVLHRNGRVETIRRAVRSVDESIFVVFDRKEDEPSNASPYILQRYSVEWKYFLDVTCHDVDLILDRDRLQVIPAILFDLDKSQVVCSGAVSGMPSEESHVTRIMEFDDKMAEHSSNSGNI